MKKILGLIWIIFLLSGLKQGIAADIIEPQVVPVDISFSAENISGVGQEATFNIRVTPQKDIPAVISCLLPTGIEPIKQKGLIVMPYRYKNQPIQEQQRVYAQALRLWAGPLETNIPKEFSFHAIILEQKTYEFIIRVESPGNWKTKEQNYTLTVY